MRNAHSVAAVRAAERELMARLPPGALMLRAAAGLGAVCAGLVPRVYGSRVVVLAGSGLLNHPMGVAVVVTDRYQGGPAEPAVTPGEQEYACHRR